MSTRRIGPGGTGPKQPKVVSGVVDASHPFFEADTLQDVVDFAYEQGYRAVQMPPGEYGTVDLVNRTSDDLNGVSLFGVGSANRAQGQFETKVDMPTITGSGAHGINVPFATIIENIKIAIPTGQTGDFDGIHLTDPGCIIRGCTIEQADRDGIRLTNGSSENRITDCFFNSSSNFFGGNRVTIGTDGFENVITGNPHCTVTDNSGASSRNVVTNNPTEP